MPASASPSPAQLIDALASTALTADPRSKTSLSEVLATLEQVAQVLQGAEFEAQAVVVRNAQSGLSEYLRSSSNDGTAVLAMVTAAAMTLQQTQRPVAAAEKVVRDSDTVEVMAAFLEEGGDGLARADEILMAADRGGLDAGAVNALFRVFHSIKGLAGFIDLPQVCAVAHTTETLLDLVRDARTTLEGERLNLVFDSTAVMRALMGRVRTALENGTAVAEVSEVNGLVQRLRDTIANVEAQSSRGPSGPPSAPDVCNPPPPTQPGSAVPVAALSPALPPGTQLGSAVPVAALSPAPPPPPGPSGPRQESERLRETLKVDVQRVDSVVEMIGELIIVESMVVNAPELADVQSLKLRNYIGQLAKISRDLQDMAMRMRMVPVRGVFQKLARLTRDLAHKTDRRVVLSTSGEDTELDRSMAERLEEPLVHMVRNAVDHGIEPAAERAAAGKTETAVLRLTAAYEGGNVVIELSDDGRGLNSEAILAKARSKGLIGATEILSPEEIASLICAPGFSTAQVVTEISGRGVGMDVVKRSIEALRGRLEVRSTRGEGTTFRLVLPLTLAIIDGLLVSCGGERYIIPSLSIVESLRPAKAMVFTLGTREEFIDVRGELMPLCRLGRLFNVNDAVTEATAAIAVVVESGGRKLALLTDEVLTQQQVVIKPISSGIECPQNFSGAAILPDGRAGLILNIDRLISNALRTTNRTRRDAQHQELRP